MSSIQSDQQNERMSRLIEQDKQRHQLRLQDIILRGNMIKYEMKKKIGFAAAIMHDYSGYKLFISNMKSKKLWAFELDKFDINHQDNIQRINIIYNKYQGIYGQPWVIILINKDKYIEQSTSKVLGLCFDDNEWKLKIDYEGQEYNQEYYFSEPLNMLYVNKGNFIAGINLRNNEIQEQYYLPDNLTKDDIVSKIGEYGQDIVVSIKVDMDENDKEDVYEIYYDTFIEQIRAEFKNMERERIEQQRQEKKQ